MTDSDQVSGTHGLPAAVLCEPAVGFPEHVLTQADTLALAARLHTGHPELRLALRLIENTGVLKRHIVRPLEQTLRDTGFTERNRVFEFEAKKRVPPVVAEALDKAGLRAGDIDAIVLVSCTGFMMPSLTAWMINELGFRGDVVQLPIAQLGCAAGAAAVNRAADHCRAHAGANALIVACEFCSLCYQPDDHDVSSLLSNGLFGDAVAAAVVRGDGRGTGVRLGPQAAHLIPGTDDWIAYEVRDTGFHFRLNKGVPATMRRAMPHISAFTERNGRSLPSLDFHVIHTGGPRVLDALRTDGGVAEDKLWASRQTLTEHGNIASAAVFDVLRRLAEAKPTDGAHGLIAGFGPGITVELTLGTWQNDDVRRPVRGAETATVVAGGAR